MKKLIFSRGTISEISQKEMENIAGGLGHYVYVNLDLFESRFFLFLHNGI
jgi:hypothetical protein